MSASSCAQALTLPSHAKPKRSLVLLHHYHLQGLGLPAVTLSRPSRKSPVPSPSFCTITVHCHLATETT